MTLHRENIYLQQVKALIIRGLTKKSLTEKECSGNYCSDAIQAPAGSTDWQTDCSRAFDILVSHLVMLYKKFPQSTLLSTTDKPNSG